jgi:molybdenum cofactor cytidylyltransferase
VVLAAGQGRRFGGDKLLAQYRGRPLLSHVLAAVEEACNRGLVAQGHVVVAAGNELAASLVRNSRLAVLVNHAPNLGLSHSLRIGLASLESETEAGAAIIFLGDQPMVRLQVIEQLVRVWQEGRGTMVRPRYEAQADAPGHPVLLSRALWAPARQLKGDVGFKELFGAASAGIVTLDVSGDNPDVDTPDDLQALDETTDPRPAAPWNARP